MGHGGFEPPSLGSEPRVLDQTDTNAPHGGAGASRTPSAASSVRDAPGTLLLLFKWWTRRNSNPHSPLCESGVLALHHEPSFFNSVQVFLLSNHHFFSPLFAADSRADAFNHNMLRLLVCTFYSTSFHLSSKILRRHQVSPCHILRISLLLPFCPFLVTSNMLLHP